MTSSEYNWPLIYKGPLFSEKWIENKPAFSLKSLLEILLVFNVEIYKKRKYRNNVFIDSPRIHTVNALCSLGLCNYFERSFIFCVIKEEFLALSRYSTIWPYRRHTYLEKCVNWLLVFEEHSDLCWVVPLDLVESDPQVTIQLFTCLFLILIYFNWNKVSHLAWISADICVMETVERGWTWNWETKIVFNGPHINCVLFLFFSSLHTL